MKLKVTVRITPATGDVIEREIEIETSVPMGEALKAAGITVSKNMQVAVNGQPVPDKELRKPGLFGGGQRQRVDVTERASGS